MNFPAFTKTRALWCIHWPVHWRALCCVTIVNSLLMLASLTLFLFSDRAPLPSPIAVATVNVQSVFDAQKRAWFEAFKAAPDESAALATFMTESEAFSPRLHRALTSLEKENGVVLLSPACLANPEDYPDLTAKLYEKMGLEIPRSINPSLPARKGQNT